MSALAGLVWMASTGILLASIVSRCGGISPRWSPPYGPLLVVLGWNLGRFWERRDDEPVMALVALAAAVVLAVTVWRGDRWERVRSGGR